ncbi:hypothetical protein V7024_04235 [Bacillus sp. JJ864]
MKLPFEVAFSFEWLARPIGLLQAVPLLRLLLARAGYEKKQRRMYDATFFSFTTEILSLFF